MESIKIDQITQVIRPFPIIADRVLRLVREDDVNFQELTQLISTDPALSSLLISLANSPLYGLIHRKVDSVHRAILVLGRDHVVEAVMVHIMKSVRSMVRTSWPTGDIYFWQHSVAVGIVTRLLTNQLHLPHSQQSLLAGLLHDIGKLLLLAHNSDLYLQVLERAAEATVPLHLLEEEAFGMNHAEVGAMVCEKWNLPQEFIHTIRTHHAPPEPGLDSLSNLVRNANMIVKLTGIGDAANTFISKNKLSFLPHTKISWSQIETTIRELPQLVKELTAIIFGAKTAERSMGMDLLYGPQNGSVIVSISDKSEEMLLRYTLAAMGYSTLTNSTERSWNSQHEMYQEIEGVVTDQPHLFTGGEHSMIRYDEWRTQQDISLDGHNTAYFNCTSLKKWLHLQFKQPTVMV